MKTFSRFVTEAKEIHDREGLGSGTGTTHRGGSKIGAERKLTAPERRRTKAIGGGKTAPAKSYKARKDIGTQRQRSEREQQPTRERGSAKLTAKQAQRKAYLERKARQSGVQGKPKDLEKAADKLLTKKTKKTVDPNYKPQKGSGLSAAERKAVTKKGERKLRDLRLQSTGKKKESELKHPVTQKEITRRNKLKK